MQDVNQLIIREMIDEYFYNIEKIDKLKEKVNGVIRYYEEINKENNIEIKKLKDENKKIEKIIENFMIINNKSDLNINNISICLNTEYKVAAKTNKKNLLIQYIKDNKLPVNLITKTDYDKKDLINYLTSPKYAESFKITTREIENFVNFEKIVSIEIKIENLISI